MLKKIFLFLILLITPQITFAEGISSNIEDGIYTFKIPLKKYGEKLKPYVAQELTTTSDLFKTGNYKLVVNGGYFDIMTGAPVSNVIIEGKRNPYASPLKVPIIPNLYVADNTRIIPINSII